MENDFYEIHYWIKSLNTPMTFVIGPVTEETKQQCLEDLHFMIEELREDLGEILNNAVSIVDDETYEKYKFYECLLNVENKILKEYYNEQI